jgi:hypothetical protein
MRNILIAVFALVLVASLANAQLASSASSGLYTVEVVGNLAVAANDGEVTGLSPGYTYTVNPDVNGAFGGIGGVPVTPQITGNEGATPMEFDVTADAGTTVQVTFELPTVLTGQGIGGALKCSFGPQSLYYAETGQLLNPAVPNVLTSGAGGGGQYTLFLGMTVVIPGNTATDIYQGVVSCTASITGL